MDSDILIYGTLFVLSFVGSFVGINFGGSMLFVMPVLLGLGIEPVAALLSTRPAIILQSLIGIKTFKIYSDISKNEYCILIVTSCIGATFGVNIITNLRQEEAAILMIFLTIALSLFAKLKYIIIDNLNIDDGYFYKDGNAVKYILVGGVPAIVGGLIGTGGGVIVVLLCLLILKKNIRSASYIEKVVTLGHASIVALLLVSANTIYVAHAIFGLDHGFGHLLIWLCHPVLQLHVKARNFQNHAALVSLLGPNDDQGPIFISAGTILGAYIGGRTTMRLNIYWMYSMFILLCMTVLYKIFIAGLT